MKSLRVDLEIVRLLENEKFGWIFYVKHNLINKLLQLGTKKKIQFVRNVYIGAWGGNCGLL